MNNFLKRDEELCLKGLGAFSIMIGHIAPAVIGFFFPGDLWVGIFFFYSGYGLMISYRKKENYLSHFIRRKIINIYIPFAVAEISYLLSRAVIEHRNYSYKDLFFSVLGIKLSNSVLWYIVEIMVIYFIFWLIHYNRNRVQNEWYWVILYAVFLVIGVVLDIGTWWYVSTSGFLIGILYDEILKYIDFVINHTVCKLLIVIFGVCSYCYMKYVIYMGKSVLGIKATYVFTFIEMIMVPIFILTWMIILQKVSIKCKFLIFLGTISYDIYMIHMLTLLWISPLKITYCLKCILAIIATICLSSLCYRVRKHFRRDIEKTEETIKCIVER